jgi:uncharacterized protein DUF4241
VPHHPIRLVAAVAVLIVAAVIAGCGGAFPHPREDPGVGDPGATDTRPRPSLGFTVATELDPRSTCVLDPDPVNGGHPAPPAPVAEAGDPTDPTGVVEVTSVGLGDIVLPSDQLIVTDFFAMGSFFLPDAPRVELHGFTGRAPVCVHIARFEPADQRVAFIHVRLTDDPVERWIVGTAGFGVDGGTGGIGSAEALRLVNSDEAMDLYLDVINASSVNTWAWANITTDPASGANVIGFSTGYGDGGFPVYAGIGRDGKVVSVVIDCLVLPWRWVGRIGTIARS